MLEFPDPEADDNVIQEALFDAVQSALDVTEMLSVLAAEPSEILDGETVGISTLTPFCMTAISLLREPEESPVSETVTVPVRFIVLGFAEVLTVMVFPLVETVIQLSLVDVEKVPSVETVAIEEPPSALKLSDVGATVRYLPS